MELMMNEESLSWDELPTEQETREELAEKLGCKPEEIEVAVDQVYWKTANELSFYVQQIDVFDGPAIKIKLPQTRFLYGGLAH
jgi:hypothetical protein